MHFLYNYFNLFALMGSCDCSISKDYYDSRNWIVLEQHSHYSIIKNMVDETTILQKWWCFDRPQKQDYFWRRQQNQVFFPNVIDVNSQKDQRTSKQHYYAITRPLVRLSNINNLSRTEVAFIAYQVLPGVQILCKRFGEFGINSDMIFINEEGQPLIWINPNISQSSPLIPLKSMNVKQEDMVEQTLKAIIKSIKPYEKFPISSFRQTYKRAQYQLNQFMKTLKKPITKIVPFKVYSEERQKEKTSTFSISQTRSAKNSDGQFYQHMFRNTVGSNRLNPPYQLLTNQNTNSNRRIRSYYQTYGRITRDPDDMLEELIREQKITF